MKKAVIIGAGFSGLSSAIHLAVRGWDVHVLDSRADRAAKLSPRDSVHTGSIPDQVF